MPPLQLEGSKRQHPHPLRHQGAAFDSKHNITSFPSLPPVPIFSRITLQLPQDALTLCAAESGDVISFSFNLHPQAADRFAPRDESHLTCDV
jgi:hypothetical protein